METTDYRLLSPADVETAAEVISQAFVEDPLCRYMLPLRRTRQKTLQKFFRIYGELSIRQNRGYGVGEPLEGVAYWIAPGGAGLSINMKSLPIFLPIVFTFYPLGLFRARGILRTMDELHEKHAPGPHYYLDNIGVLRSARGKGAASKLIRPFLAKAVAEKVCAYTDTVTEANVGVYEHLGFQCVEKREVAGTGVTVWALRTRVPEREIN